MNFVRPEYIYRPLQILRRIAYALGFKAGDVSAMTPWGLAIAFDPHELHGRAMLTLGLSDLRTNEIISRLVRPGDTVVDIGANIGIMTSLMAIRAGNSGSVYAFEPHPYTRARLEANVATWKESDRDTAAVHILPYAVSNIAGSARLIEPQHFCSNSGVATLEPVFTVTGIDSVRFEIETVNFDEWSTKLAAIRLVKIDVEGHEDSVLDGMEACLESRKIDYVIFEEMRVLPTAATEKMHRFGYSCYMIDRNLWGPILKDASYAPVALLGEATNIIAVAPGCDIQRLLMRGWDVLR